MILKTNRFDAAAQFMSSMRDCKDPEYCALFPNPQDRWDLCCIQSMAREGRYGEDDAPTSAVGVVTLFEDLQAMVRNSKLLNASNPHFLPWRMADMLEKAIFRLKCALADARGISSLQESVQFDLVQLKTAMDDEKVSL
jgi:hypothetical protein